MRRVLSAFVRDPKEPGSDWRDGSAERMGTPAMRPANGSGLRAIPTTINRGRHRCDDRCPGRGVAGRLRTRARIVTEKRGATEK
jgi:hypothetical protein